MSDWEALTSREQAGIDAADGLLIEDGFYVAASRNSLTGDWLRTGSPFSGEQTFPKGFDFGAMSKRTQRALVEYLSASVVLHSIDAWAYLGRAVSALIHGSLPIAQHLLYYSELRSALSILARNGIFCVDRTNFYVDVNGNVARLGNNKDGTHVAVWRYLDAWSQTPSAVKAIGGNVRIVDTALTDWLDVRHGLASAGFVVPQLLSSWGADLRRYARDQKWRNYNSYGPQYVFATKHGHTPLWLSGAVSELWKLIWSAGTDTFAELDAWLVRGAVHRAFLERQGPDGVHRFGRVLDSAIGSIVSEPLRARARAAVGRDLGGAPLLVRLAELRPHRGLSGTVAVQGMLGRALILARVATGNVKSLALSAGVDASKFERWGLDVFERSGIQVASASVQGLLDTQSDVALDLEEIRDPEPLDAIADLATVASGWSGCYQRLSKVEQALVWSLVA